MPGAPGAVLGPRETNGVSVRSFSIRARFRCCWNASGAESPNLKATPADSDPWEKSGEPLSDRKRISHYLAYNVDGADKQVVVWDTIDILVGRSKTQDIVIADVEVSREHARFFRKEDHHLVEDLDTGIGTTVNGEPIKVRELQHGDVVRIGSFELIYARTDDLIRPGRYTCHASDLKSNLAVPAKAGLGRTVLGFDPDDSEVLSAPTAVPELDVAHAVSADGTLEELDSDNPLGLSIHPDSVGSSEPIRDLDAELEKPDPAQISSELNLSDFFSLSTYTNPEPREDPVNDERPLKLRMVLEIEAATFEIAALVTALYGQQFGHPLLRIDVKKADEE